MHVCLATPVDQRGMCLANVAVFGARVNQLDLWGCAVVLLPLWTFLGWRWGWQCGDRAGCGGNPHREGMFDDGVQGSDIPYEHLQIWRCIRSRHQFATASYILNQFASIQFFLQMSILFYMHYNIWWFNIAKIYTLFGLIIRSAKLHYRTEMTLIQRLSTSRVDVILRPLRYVKMASRHNVAWASSPNVATWRCHNHCATSLVTLPNRYQKATLSGRHVFAGQFVRRSDACGCWRDTETLTVCVRVCVCVCMCSYHVICFNSIDWLAD